jgi:MYXO-CTERM domain-containing protein
MSTPGLCAFSDERDTQDTSPEEPRRERDTQDTSTPHTREGPHQGVRRPWAALAGLTAIERRRRRSSSHAAPTKNEKKR